MPLRNCDWCGDVYETSRTTAHTTYDVCSRKCEIPYEAEAQESVRRALRIEAAEERRRASLTQEERDAEDQEREFEELLRQQKAAEAAKRKLIFLCVLYIVLIPVVWWLTGFTDEADDPMFRVTISLIGPLGAVFAAVTHENA